MGEVVELVEDFGTARLKPGVYVAASDGDAYGPLLALITAGGAMYMGEHLDTRGRKMVAARVGSVRNPVLFSGTIGLGPSYFTSVLQQYKDWREKWWREAIQNSVDAGAKEIRCSAIENPDGTWTVSMQDNGKGMPLDILVGKFLDMGGTTKVGQAGAAGGFGKAKELLLFPWLRWEVYTRDRIAKGTGAQYTVEDAPKLRGTKITVVMASDQFTTAQAAMSFIEKCYLPGVRFIVSQNQRGRDPWETKVRAKLKAKDLLETVPDKAEIYVTKVNYNPWNMLVRTQGLYMFSKHIGTTEKKQVIVEITAPSIEVLTSNRDGFSDDQLERAVGSLAERAAKDVRSALRAKRGLVRQKYEGGGKFKARRRQSVALAEMGPIGPTKKGVVEIADEDVVVLSQVAEDIRQADQGSSGIPNRALATELLSNTTYTGAHHVEEAIRQLVWEPDFFLINEIENFSVPKKFKPETMTPRVSKLIRTWTELCRYVLMQLGNFREYGVGFIFSEDAGAAYLREEGEEWLLLNPYKDLNARKDTWAPTKTPGHPGSDLKWLYAAAVHECTHLADGIEYHDESFAAALTFNIAKTADGFKHVRKIVKAIRMRDEAVADVLRFDNPQGPVLTQTDLVGRLKF